MHKVILHLDRNGLNDLCTCLCDERLQLVVGGYEIYEDDSPDHTQNYKLIFQVNILAK